ncbi:uncharacterized protein LOC143846107 [Tasmannia lanceolata]|uniref:uncharacterized protein LOC143846107 n=1 Tax=Tasmannia lanceolata TaxID=3420 RepID=UPI0040648E39
MVMISGTSETETPHRFMAPVPKSQPLHNFSMPFLKWGNQKHLRCMKVNQNGDIISPDLRSSASEAESDGGKRAYSENQSSRNHFSSSIPSKKFQPLERFRIGSSGKSEREADDGIEEIRAKLLVHLRSAAKKMKFQVPESGEGEESVVKKMKFPVPENGDGEEESAARPWNLRTRRAACKAPNEIRGDSRRQVIIPQKEPSENLMKSQRLRSFADLQTVENKERRKFSVLLTRDEIEEDFFVMTGSRPSRRPKKRAKIIQRQLDACFPGLWLSEVTLDSYKVEDIQEPGKK